MPVALLRGRTAISMNVQQQMYMAHWLAAAVQIAMIDPHVTLKVLAF